MTVLTLTACGGKKVDYTGTYTGQIDFSSFQAGMSSELGIEISDPLYMEIKLVMNDDETFTLSADEAKLKGQSVKVKNINFRSSVRLKNEMAESTFERASEQRIVKQPKKKD